MKFVLNNYEQKEVIKIIREWSNKTQKEFAEQLNKSESTIQSYELGRIDMPMSIFMEIVKKENLIVTIEKK